MKYNYKELKGICKKAIDSNLCTGCNLLELESFQGKYNCKLIIEGQIQQKNILKEGEQIHI